MRSQYPIDLYVVQFHSDHTKLFSVEPISDRQIHLWLRADLTWSFYSHCLNKPGMNETCLGD